MGNALPLLKLSADDYLAWEASQTTRHEFVDGEIYAMAGAEDSHVTVSLNAAMALRRHLSGTPCRVYISDMKVHVAAANSFFYPDVLVTCSDADRASRLIKHEPTLLVEVLSPSTAAYDRGQKFALYRQLDSLREYAVIDVEERSTDVYRRGDDGLWVLHPFAAHEAVELQSVGLSLPAEELFAEVLPPPEAE
jgi:Uma2 family endonuclease